MTRASAGIGLSVAVAARSQRMAPAALPMQLSALLRVRAVAEIASLPY
jgi:hypothetical protein